LTLTATPGCNGSSPQVSLGWTSASGASSYDIYRNGSLYYSSLTGTGFLNTAVTGGTTYSYLIRAKNAAGYTDSNTATATAPNNCGASKLLRLRVDPPIKGMTIRISAITPEVVGGPAQIRNSCCTTVKTDGNGQADIPVYLSTSGPVVYAWYHGKTWAVPLSNAVFMATLNTWVDPKLDPLNVAYARYGPRPVSQASAKWQEGGVDILRTCSRRDNYDSACKLSSSAIDAVQRGSSVSLYLHPAKINRYRATVADDTVALAEVKAAAKDMRIPLPVLAAIMSQESLCFWNTPGSCGKAQWDQGWTKITFDGGIGAMQLTGSTAASLASKLGIQADVGGDSLAASLRNNVRAAAKYLDQLFATYSGTKDRTLLSNWQCAIGAYNSGAANCGNSTYISNVKMQFVPFYPVDPYTGSYAEDDSLTKRSSHVSLKVIWGAACRIENMNGKEQLVCRR
jgi:hypothetical protein